jgi:hypothetical protein
MTRKILAALATALWIWIIPAAHMMPIDADGPSGLTDGNDFDDVIVGLTSATAAVVTPSVLLSWAIVVLGTIVVSSPTARSEQTLRRISSRAPPFIV